MFLLHPASLNSRTEQFCARIREGVRPLVMAIRPEPGCEPLDCFRNVQRKVARDGGRIQYGWSIWEWPGVFLEAEHHAVYAPANGSPWVDLTPAQTLDQHRVFLADDSAEYDFENEGVRRDNVREAVTSDELIQEFFRAAERRIAAWNTVPGVGEVKVDLATKDRLDRLDYEMAKIQFVLAMKYTPQNARCFCGSGQKFKKCHGRSGPAK